jgi:hypothetical protein
MVLKFSKRIGLSQLLACGALAASLALSSGMASAAIRHGDWPCIQREVPEISAGMVWSGGELDAQSQSWLSKPELVAVVNEATSRRRSVEEAIAAVDRFAAAHKEGSGPLLAELFTGILQRLNAERAQIMAGIKRYAKRQGSLADQIRARSVELAELNAKPERTEAERERLTALREQIDWDTRIYDERQQSLTYVCETPVLLEQRLFQIGRHMSQLAAKD